MPEILALDLNHPPGLPPALSKCPYCGLKLYIEEITGWCRNEDGHWGVDELSLRCEAEDDIDQMVGDEGDCSHSYMPYVYWLPITLRVIDWLNENFLMKVPDV
jgi:hypothetical protein